MSKTTETGESHGGSSPPPRTDATPGNDRDSAAPHGAEGPESAPEVHGAAPPLHGRAALNGPGVDVMSRDCGHKPSGAKGLCFPCWVADSEAAEAAGRPAAAPPAAAGGREPLAPSAVSPVHIIADTTQPIRFVCGLGPGPGRAYIGQAEPFPGGGKLCSGCADRVVRENDVRARAARAAGFVEYPNPAAVPSHIEPERAAAHGVAVTSCRWCGGPNTGHPAQACAACIAKARRAGNLPEVAAAPQPVAAVLPNPGHRFLYSRFDRPIHRITVLAGVPVLEGDPPVIGATYIDHQGDPYVLRLSTATPGGLVYEYRRGAIRVHTSEETWRKDVLEKGHRYCGPTGDGSIPGELHDGHTDPATIPLVDYGDDDELEALADKHNAEWRELPQQIADALASMPDFPGHTPETLQAIGFIVQRCHELRLRQAGEVTIAVAGC